MKLSQLQFTTLLNSMRIEACHHSWLYEIYIASNDYWSFHSAVARHDREQPIKKASQYVFILADLPGKLFDKKSIAA